MKQLKDMVQLAVGDPTLQNTIVKLEMERKKKNHFTLNKYGLILYGAHTMESKRRRERFIGYLNQKKDLREHERSYETRTKAKTAEINYLTCQNFRAFPKETETMFPKIAKPSL